MTAVLQRPTVVDAPQRRPHQVRGLANLHATFAKTDRAQIHWACGTGKTLLGRWLAEDLDAQTTLVLVPSLALVAQALAEWQTASDWPFDAIVVCSDRSAADAWRIEAAWWAEHGVEVTTDTVRLTGFLSRQAHRPRVVFATYHSSPVVAAAARPAGTVFDLVVCDEAHRLAGDPDERFRTVLDDQALRARRRVFATATPVYSSRAYSMSDVAIFGPVADRLDFADAIEAGLLVDYEVLVLDSSGDAGALQGEATVPAALVSAAADGLTRVLTFHSRVSHARQFAAITDGMRLPDGRTIHAAAIAGVDPGSHRQAVLDNLRRGNPGALTVVSNSRCLTEGVDVPGADGIVFADPKTSDTDIVQAIGRALRPSPGKTRGVIILPVVVADGMEEDLTTGPYAAVWSVLRALRDLDPRMAAELDHVRRFGTASLATSTGRRPGRILRFDLGGVNLSTLAARLVDTRGTNGESWARNLTLLRSWVLDHGHAAVPAAATVDGAFVGRWAQGQRRAYALGALAPERVAQLEGIPGWAWTADAAWWRADCAAVAAMRGPDGLDLNDPDVHDAPMPHRPRGAHLTMGRWCAQQRRAIRDGDLDPALVAECEAIPGWSWTAGTNQLEARMVDALSEWVDKYRDANVPDGAMWGTAKLGSFITAMRRRRAMGRLHLALLADLEVVTPAKPSPGALEWRATDTRWDINYQALLQFVSRTGGCDIPYQATEDLGGFTCSLYDWATRNRHLQRHDRLDPDRVAKLEAVAGWKWERLRTDRVKVGIGPRKHGTRLGYAAGCKCDDCTDANTEYERERQQLKAAGLETSSLVDASAARGHLRILEGQVGFRARPTMEKVTGFNKKTIDLVINGDRARIHSDVDEVLRALTAQELLDHIAANPSPRDPLPEGPTLDLIDNMLRRGWPKAWISRELGKGKTLQISRTDSGIVHRRTAEAVAALHAELETVELPQRQWRTALPTLAELRAGTPALTALED